MYKLLIGITLTLLSTSLMADWPTAKTELETESKIKEAILKNGFLYIGYYGPAGNKDGYAEYVCNVIKPHQLKPKGEEMLISIVNYYNVMRDNDWTKLGKHHCKF